jgi:deazaflavin-dependent oxidoreductase (nitroreductase family)
VDLTAYARRSTLRLTTIGRRSGKAHTVTIWFVVADAQRLYVQHARGPTADWFKNLRKNSAVQVDVGDGPLPAVARELTDPVEVARVLRLIRRKYWFAWVFQVLGMTRQAVAAEIVIRDGAAAGAPRAGAA